MKKKHLQQTTPLSNETAKHPGTQQNNLTINKDYCLLLKYLYEIIIMLSQDISDAINQISQAVQSNEACLVMDYLKIIQNRQEQIKLLSDIVGEQLNPSIRIAGKK